MLAAAVSFDLSFEQDNPAIMDLRRALHTLQTVTATLRKSADRIAEESENHFNVMMALRLHGVANLSKVAEEATDRAVQALLSP